MPRNTTTGRVLEEAVLPALNRGGYSVSEQQNVGERIGGRPHLVDCIAKKGDAEVLVSLKWQQSSGTTEQKVPFEVICLIKAIDDSNGRFEKAYVVLGGEGWTLRDCYVAEELAEYITRSSLVKIVTLENFLGRANSGLL